jgi:hypothetical protein
MVYARYCSNIATEGFADFVNNLYELTTAPRVQHLHTSIQADALWQALGTTAYRTARCSVLFSVLLEV